MMGVHASTEKVTWISPEAKIAYQRDKAIRNLEFTLSRAVAARDAAQKNVDVATAALRELGVEV